MEGKFPGGAPEAFPRESETKIAFPRGSGQVFQSGFDCQSQPGGGGKFCKGVIPGKLVSLR